MKSLKVSLLSLLVLCSVSIGAFVLAEDSYTVSNPNGTVLLADTNIQNGKIISQDNNVFNISFDIQNGKLAQSGVRYGISLVDNKGKTTSVMDDYSYEESLSLSEDSTISKNITYTAPSRLNGEYTLYIEVRNNSDLSLSLYNIGDVKLTSVHKDIQVFPETCKIIIDNKNSNNTLNKEFTIKPTDSIRVGCNVVNNTDKDVSVSPSSATHYYSIYGDLIPSGNKSGDAVVVKAKQSGVVSIELPKTEQPKKYASLVSFSSDNVSIDSVVVKYAVSGFGASINNISIDKDVYKKGDTAKATLFWSPSLIKDNKEPNNFVANIDIKSKKTSCILPITQALSIENAITEFSIPIISKCKNPQVLVTLTDSKGNTLDSKDLSFKTMHRPVHFSILQGALIILGILVVAGVAVFYFMKLKKKAK